MRFRLLAPAALLAACAGAPARPALEADDLKELRSQLQAQSALVAQQQRRIEELEVKLAALAARTQAVPAHATPVRVDPRRGIGLRNMRERVESIGGRFAIVSRPGSTQVLADIDAAAIARFRPLRSEAAA